MNQCKGTILAGGSSTRMRSATLAIAAVEPPQNSRQHN
jgi:molybdopterin-guanine dinucleotide biosynthesis protein A